AHTSGGTHCSAGQKRSLQPRDRRTTVHQPTHGAVPLAQGVPEARNHLAQPAGPPPGKQLQLGVSARLARARLAIGPARRQRRVQPTRRNPRTVTNVGNADVGGRIMVRYFYAWTPLVIVGTVVFLSLPWLGLIALMIVSLAALAAVAYAIVY